MAGIEKPLDLDGESLMPALTGSKSLVNREPMLWVFPEYGGQVAVAIGEKKVVRQGLMTKKPGAWEVYDLANDVAEQHDVAASNPEVIAEAEAVLRREVTDSLVFPLDIPGVNKPR